MKNTTEKGRAAEAVAENYYRKMGYHTLHRNYRVRRGELDLVMKRGGRLLFVEVKGRGSNWEMHAWAPSWGPKIRRLRAAARLYILAHRDLDFSEIAMEIVFVTQGRVSARIEQI